MIGISRAGRAERGFSLLELLLVLVLLGLAGLMVMPSFDRGLNKLKVRESALELGAVARDLRSRAIYESEAQTLIVDAVENSYRDRRGRKVRLSPDVRISKVEGGEPLGEGKRRFLFFPSGRMLGGSIGVASREGPASYTVRFDPLSGSISVVRGIRL